MSVTRRRAAVALALAASGGLVAAATGAAKDTRTTVVRSAHNSHQNKNIVVNSRGMTLYLLTGDKASATRSKCTHKMVGGLDCLTIWKPLTVSSASTSRIKAGPGVTGAIRLFQRGRGSYQVTLRGMPLYTYAGVSRLGIPGDTHRGDVRGEGIHSFNGVWHTLPASTRKATPPPPTPMPPPTYPPY